MGSRGLTTQAIATVAKQYCSHLVCNCFADPSLVQGKRCIELGAGTGVAGLTAALLGALVVLTGNKACGG